MYKLTSCSDFGLGHGFMTLATLDAETGPLPPVCFHPARVHLEHLFSDHTTFVILEQVAFRQH